jgi:predicted nicotinamide N-methyase
MSGTTFTVGSHTFDIAEGWGLQPGGVRGTGSRVWPASVELARFLADNEELIRAKRVIEWGAGVGALPSLVAARTGAAIPVLASDGEPSAIPLLEHNVARNSEPGACKVRQLRWGCKEEALLMDADVILGEFSCIVAHVGRCRRASPE